MESVLKINSPIKIYVDQSFKTDWNRAVKSHELCKRISEGALFLAACATALGLMYAGFHLPTSVLHSCIGVGVASIIVLGVSEVAGKHFRDQCEEKFSNGPQAIEMESV